MFIFLIGLLFLLYFSYCDLKKSEINNLPILIFLVVGLLILLWTNKPIILLVCLFWFLLTLFFWKFKILGGADVKILSILPIYYLSGTNILIKSFIFLFLFWVLGMVYGSISKLIIKKRYIPFLPLITLTYIILKITIK